MVQIDQFTTVGTLAALILVIAQFAKAFLEPKYIPYLSVASGVVLMVVFGGLTEGVNTANDLVGYALGGLFAGLTAVGGYEATIDKFRLGR